MITYQGFITELRRLVAEARNLRSAKKKHNDERFRKWRNELEGLLSQIVQVDYLLPCSVRTKARSYGYSANEFISDEELLKSYQMEMNDTINELEFIIVSYEKHGEPPKGGKEKPALKWPEKITLAWLFHHAPISLWLKVGALTIGIFSAGVYVGQTDLYMKIANLFDGKQAGASVEK